MPNKAIKLHFSYKQMPNKAFKLYITGYEHTPNKALNYIEQIMNRCELKNSNCI